MTAESNSEVRFKLLLFRTGLRAYIGAADALSGNPARGRAEAEGAMSYARELMRENAAKADRLHLAQQLEAQITVPLALIAGMRSPAPKPSV